MPISVKTDLEWGEIWYIKTDPFQQAGALVGIVYLPGKQLKLRLSFEGEEYEVYDFECTKEPQIIDGDGEE